VPAQSSVSGWVSELSSVATEGDARRRRWSEWPFFLSCSSFRVQESGDAAAQKSSKEQHVHAKHATPTLAQTGPL